MLRWYKISKLWFLEEASSISSWANSKTFIWTCSDYYGSDAKIKNLVASIVYSSKSFKLSIATLMEEIKHVVAEKNQFIYRDSSIKIALFVISEYEDCDASTISLVFHKSTFLQVSFSQLRPNWKKLGFNFWRKLSCVNEETQRGKHFWKFLQSVDQRVVRPNKICFDMKLHFVTPKTLGFQNKNG